MEATGGTHNVADIGKRQASILRFWGNASGCFTYSKQDKFVVRTLKLCKNMNSTLFAHYPAPDRTMPQH